MYCISCLVVCEILFCSEFPNIPDNADRVTRRRTQAIAMRYAFHTNTHTKKTINTINCQNKYRNIKTSSLSNFQLHFSMHYNPKQVLSMVQFLSQTFLGISSVMDHKSFWIASWSWRMNPGSKDFSRKTIPQHYKEVPCPSQMTFTYI